MALQIALAVVLIPLVLSSVYLGVLAMLALLPARASLAPVRGLRAFRIVIPAHNEATTLPKLFESLESLEYPRDLVDVVIVAHNCTDATASLAREHGYEALELTELSRVGKGHALEHALAHPGSSYDAIVFIDADCTVSPNLLAVFNQRIDAGARALQAFYTMKVEQQSSTRVIRDLALVLVHRVRPRGRRWYGGSAGLKGSGMCFTREIIERVGWHEIGLAEDIDEHNRLLLHGVRVEFVEQVHVTGLAPSRLADAQAQHARWEAGRLRAARRALPSLLVASVRTRSLASVDAAVDLLVPPMSLLALTLTAALAASILLGSRPLIMLAAAGEASLALYLATGVLFLRPSLGDALRAIVSAPRFALWKLRVYARAVSGKKSWERTRRA